MKETKYRLNNESIQREQLETRQRLQNIRIQQEMDDWQNERLMHQEVMPNRRTRRFSSSSLMMLRRNSIEQNMTDTQQPVPMPVADKFGILNKFRNT